MSLPASHTIRRTLSAFALAIVAGACNKDTPPDSYGNFEADETIVASETAGQLQEFLPTEGSAVTAGTRVAQIDTIQLALERDQLVAQRAGIADHRAEVTRQIRAIDIQLEIANRAKERTDRLFAQQAATATQRDAQEQTVRVLTEQLAGARVGLARVASDVAALDVRIKAVVDRMRRASIVTPTGGTVLATYVRTGEFIQPGQQLYRVANLDTLTLRAYVTGGQLTQFRLGQTLAVHVDDGSKTLRTYPGTIAWISSRAEFTPTPVQTRDARGDLVYAIKVRVPNTDGALKIGMPGDVSLHEQFAASTTMRAADGAGKR